MKYINQLDYPHLPYITRTGSKDPEKVAYGQTTTVATSACGLCAAITVVDRLLVNVDFTLEDASLDRYTAVIKPMGTPSRIAPAVP